MRKSVTPDAAEVKNAEVVELVVYDEMGLDARSEAEGANRSVRGRRWSLGLNETWKSS